MEFNRAVERRTSLVRHGKTMTKERGFDNSTTLQVYDVPEFDRSSFDPRHEMAIIIDNARRIILPEASGATLIGVPANGITSGTTDRVSPGIFENRNFRIN